MRKVIPFILCSSYFLSSCSGDEYKANTDSTADSQKYDCIIPPPDSIPEAEHGMPEVINECYRFDKGDEHKSIEITIVLDSAWGNFQWGIDGKDGVKGEFTGNFRGDTLWIMYQAIMEGHLIPREVAFLKRGDKLYEAQDTQEENAKGTYYYKHKKMLEYSDPDPMVKVPCM
jgi:hypothetical protein